MAPKGRAPASRHLVCASCSSWVQFDSAEMSRGAYAFTCKGCRQVARLVGELGDHKQTMDIMQRVITGQGLEEARRNRGSSGKTGSNG